VILRWPYLLFGFFAPKILRVKPLIENLENLRICLRKLHNTGLGFLKSEVKAVLK
jgi:hypothetical protein